MKISSFVAGVIFLALGPASYGQPPPPSPYDKMTLEERVGQVFIWTYPGTAFNPATERWLSKFQPGALIVFGRNIRSPQQIAKYNSDLQKFSARKMKAPFFLMIDQEGGTVTRLRTQVPLPSALALGRMNDLAFNGKFGRAVADVLRSVGFNVNLAPVLDISDPEHDSFIGNRAFGDDPDEVSDNAGAYAEGLAEGGILPTAKHFPGHGGVKQDSHQTMPRKLDTLEELAEKDLVPFEEYAHSEYPRALMMAHMSLPNIDPSGLPSTYSSLLIQDYLRGKLKYDGLIITDDLEMNGASVDHDVGERAIRAFAAGNDMLMLAGSPAHQKLAFNAVIAAIKSGRLTEARLRKSVERILAFKAKISPTAPFVYNEKQSRASITELEALSREVLHKNIHHALEGRTWPEVAADTRALVLSSDKRFFASFTSTFKGQAQFFHLTPASLERAAKVLANKDYALAVYYVTGAQTAHWLSSLPAETRAKMIVVNTGHDAEVESQNAYLSVLNINTHYPEGGADLAQSLSAPPEPRVPASQPAN